MSGFQAIINNKEVVATATLKLDYHEPIFTDTYYLIKMKEERVDERRTKILGKIMKINDEGKSKNDCISTEALMVSIDWRGLSSHDKSKKDNPEK